MKLKTAHPDFPRINPILCNGPDDDDKIDEAGSRCTSSRYELIRVGPNILAKCVECFESHTLNDVIGAR